MKTISNRVTGIIGLMFSILFLVFAIAIPAPPGLTQDLMGSRAFPIICGVIMALCTAGILFLPAEKMDEEAVGWEGTIRLLPYVVILALYVLTLPYLGLILGTTLVLFAFLNRISRQTWWKDLILCVVISIGLWFLFVKVLRVTLPAGIWG
jgi:putative tricarboxylic transport membrane protein